MRTNLHSPLAILIPPIFQNGNQEASRQLDF